MKYLLDTNCIIEHFRRGEASAITRRMLEAPPGSLFTCSVVLGELYFGARRSEPEHQTANLALIEQLQKQIPSLPYDDLAAQHYGAIRKSLTDAGTPIGPNDLLIAAIASARQMTLVTSNTREFGRVPNLLIEDWA